MSARTLISVEEYLASAYEPDCDYVEGRVEERNVGEVTHARLQARVGAYLLARYENQGIVVMTEVRVQVRHSRFRVPDVCITVGEPGEEVLTKPPFVCIEILSPEDRMSRVEVRINDYLAMGVPYVWVLDRETKQAFTATAADGLREVKNGILRSGDPVVEVPLNEISAKDVYMKRTADAKWQGDLKSGSGTISTASGTLAATPYSFHSRFEQGKGTNPEELLAAAHAGCFTMALSNQLAQAGFKAENLETTCTVTLDKTEGGFGITESHLELKAKVPGITKEAFDQATAGAKTGCPVSKLYNTNITLNATLEG